jgi:hypothetical protein
MSPHRLHGTNKPSKQTEIWAQNGAFLGVALKQVSHLLRPAVVARVGGAVVVGVLSPLPGRPWWRGGCGELHRPLRPLWVLVLFMVPRRLGPARAGCLGGGGECSFWCSRFLFVVHSGASLWWLFGGVPAFTPDS